MSKINLGTNPLAEWAHQVGNEVFSALRVAAQLRLVYAGEESPPVANMLTVRSGRLLRAVMGTGANDRTSSIARIEPTIKGVNFVWGVNLPYGNLHESGGVRPITPKMRKFFWAMYYINRWGKQAMWKRLAIRGKGQKDFITFPPRPFLRPAIDDSRTMINELIKKSWGDTVKYTVDRIFENNKQKK